MSRIEGVIAVSLTLIGWSAVPLFLRYFANEIDAWTSNGWRYGFSALLWAPVILWGLARNSLPKHLWKRALVPSIVNSMGQVLFTWAHYKIDPGLLVFSLRFQIVFVALGAAILFANERSVMASKGFIFGMAMVMAGTIGTISMTNEAFDDATVAGLLLAFGAGMGFAGYALSVRYFMQGIRPVVAFAAISQYTALAMVVLMLVIGERSGLTALDMSGMNIFLLLLSAVIGIALGHVCYYTAIAKLGVAISTGIIQLQPFLVAVGSYFWFKEQLTTLQWISGMIAVAGAALVLRVQHSGAAEEPARPGEEPELEEWPADHVAAASLAEGKEAEEECGVE